MKVSIVIPWFNTKDLAEKNLPKVLSAAENPKNSISEIIVVDDGSRDGSADEIKRKFSEIKVIRHKVNRGFPAAVNTGVRAAKWELICLMNSDVLPEVDFLEAAIPDFKNPKVFAVSLNESGIFGWARGKFIDGFIGHEPGGKSEENHETFWVSGGSGVFSRKIWMELGGMDEKLFSPFYWEDLDISYRAMKRGYKLLWEPSAKVFHDHETTINKLPQKFVDKIKERNQLLFIWKNITSRRLFGKHLAGLTKRVFTHPGYLKVVASALSKLGPLAKARAKETKESKVSDEAILARFS